MTRHTRAEEKTLRPVVPSYAIEQRYRKKLRALVDEMNRSVVYWLRATYAANQPIIAQDESPASIIQRTIKRMSSQWSKRFDAMADKLAAAFAKETADWSSRTMANIMRDAGFTVRFTMTPAMRDIRDATVRANVALIRSIPQQFLANVEGIVMRGVQVGGDLQQITDDLMKQHGVQRRRAELIARDQNRKATAAFSRARQMEVGITTAVWLHSHAGKVPRPTHVKAGRERVVFNLAEGWFDPDPRVNRHILPGELINCRCLAKPIIKGFS